MRGSICTQGYAHVYTHVRTNMSSLRMSIHMSNHMSIHVSTHIFRACPHAYPCVQCTLSCERPSQRRSADLFFNRAISGARRRRTPRRLCRSDGHLTTRPVGVRRRHAPGKRRPALGPSRQWRQECMTLAPKSPALTGDPRPCTPGRGTGALSGCWLYNWPTLLTRHLGRPILLFAHVHRPNPPNQFAKR